MTGESIRKGVSRGCLGSVDRLACQIGGLDHALMIDVTVTLPKEAGNYTLIAELTDSQGHTVRSLRDVVVK